MKPTKQHRLASTALLILLSLLGACSEKPQDMLTSAKAYLAKNDNKAAVIQIKNALQVEPDLPEARFLLGTALLNSGDAGGAETELRKAYALKHPQDMVIPPLAQALLARGQAKKLTDEFSRHELSQPEAMASLQLSLASAYALQGEQDLSESALKWALVADPDYAPALLVQARLKAGQGDLSGAKAIVNDVIAKSPNSHEAWKLKGDLVMASNGLYSDALAAYRKALEVKPDFPPGHAALISILLQQGALTDASTQIEKLKRLAPSQPQTHYLEGQLALAQKDYKRARDMAQQVLKILPSNALGLQLAGAAELQLNALPAAESYLRQALQAAPQLSLARRLLVVCHLRSGQPAKALATLLPGISGATVDPELLSVAGEVYLQNGDIKKAESYFAQASKLMPKDSKKRTALALTHLISGSVDSAFDELQGISDSDTGTTADMAMIGAYFKRQEFDKALVAIDGLEKKQPNKPLTAQLRAQALLAKKDRAGARASLERALVLEADYFTAIAGLAEMDVAEERPEDARKRFEAALARNPKNGQAHLALAELAIRSGASRDAVVKLFDSAVAANPTDVVARLRLIDFHLRNKDLKQASSAAQNATAALPGNSDVLDALGRAQQASGENNQAIATFTALANLLPMSPTPHMRLADIYLTEKNSQAAELSLRKALELKPDYLPAQKALVVLDMHASKPLDALATARDVQKQRPGQPAGYLLEGSIHAAQKNWDAAIAVSRTGLKQSKSTELALQYHTALQATGKSVDAEKFASDWLRDNPRDAVFLLYLGDRAIARKDYASAERSYTSVVKLQPNNALAYNNLAWVSGKLNRDTAIAYAETANRLAPNQSALLDTLAMLQSEHGNYTKALETQGKAIALDPAKSVYRLSLAKIHLKGGNKDLAKKELVELKRQGDRFAAQDEVSRLLMGL